MSPWVTIFNNRLVQTQNQLPCQVPNSFINLNNFCNLLKLSQLNWSWSLFWTVFCLARSRQASASLERNAAFFAAFELACRVSKLDSRINFWHETSQASDFFSLTPLFWQERTFSEDLSQSKNSCIETWGRKNKEKLSRDSFPRKVREPKNIHFGQFVFSEREKNWFYETKEVPPFESFKRNWPKEPFNVLKLTFCSQRNGNKLFDAI